MCNNISKVCLHLDSDGICKNSKNYIVKMVNTSLFLFMYTSVILKLRKTSEEVIFCCLVAKLCLTFLQPHGLSGLLCQAPLSMGFPTQEYWSGLPCPPPGDLTNLG